MQRRVMLILGVVVLMAIAFLAGVYSQGDDDETSSTSTRRTTTSRSDSGSPDVTTTTACVLDGSSAELQTGTGSGGTMLLTDVRIGRPGCFERIVFEFRQAEGSGGTPAFGVRYENEPFHEDGSGKVVLVQGNDFLIVRVEPASGADLSAEGNGAPTYTGSATLTPTGLPHVRQARRIGDYEGVITWVVGLDSRRPFKAYVLASPARLVIDLV